jgi:hypothetical protein
MVLILLQSQGMWGVQHLTTEEGQVKRKIEFFFFENLVHSIGCDFSGQKEAKLSKNSFRYRSQ